MADTDITLLLPSIPKDCYYEDYVAAILNAGKYYLDRSVHRTEDGVDLLELDIVATKFETDHYENTIVEVKSGGWGIKDLFKVNGWLNFLAHQKAAFIYQVAPNRKDEATMQTVAKELNIDLLSNPTLANGKIDDTAILKSFGIDLTHVPKHAIKALRYSYDMERIMLDYIHVFSQNNIQYQTPSRVYQYFRKLIDETFFIKDPLARLRYLTDTAIGHRNIACILDNELKGKGILTADECTKFDNLFEIENPPVMQCRPVDVALYAQLFNRLLVLKGITEYILTPKTADSTWIEEYMAKLSYNAQNNNIRQAIEELRTHSHFYLYPYFYQIFLFVYGGFFMVARKDEEYKILSDITGVPIDEIDTALEVWNTLFPTSTSWMTTINHGGLYYMRFVPSPLRGLGVNYRRHLYAPVEMEDSEELFNNLKSIVGDHCYNDMIHWNNAAYIMLKQDPNLHQQVGTTSNKFERHLKSAEDYIQRKGIYSDVKCLTDLAVAAKCRNFNLQGFLCMLTPEMYDLYIIKSKNNLLSFPINQVVGDLCLDQGKMRYCFVLGTDEHYKKSDDDTIWIVGTIHHSSLDRLENVVNELDKII
jgi:hypothetical protein